MMSLVNKCRKLFGRNQLDMDGHVYEPYESEKVRQQRKSSQRQEKCMSVSFFFAGLLAAGGFGYIIYLVSFSSCLFQFE